MVKTCINVAHPPYAPVEIGFHGEKNASPIILVFADWLADYPDGACSVTMRRPDGEEYILMSGIHSKVVEWKPEGYDTCAVGIGSIEAQLTAENVCVLSEKIPIRVLESQSGETGPSTPEDPAPPWTLHTIEEATRIKDQTEAASQLADSRASEAEAAAQMAEAAVSKTSITLVAKVEQGLLKIYDMDGNPAAWDVFDAAEAAGRAIFVSIPPLPNFEAWGSVLAHATNFVRENGELLSFDLIGPCVQPDPDSGVAIGGTFYLPIVKGDAQNG